MRAVRRSTKWNAGFQISEPKANTQTRPGAGARENGLHLSRALGVRHEARVRPEHGAHRGVQRAVENPFARELQAGHGAHILTREPGHAARARPRRRSALPA